MIKIFSQVTLDVCIMPFILIILKTDDIKFP